MFFGGFLALLYVATNRLSFVVIGLGAVRASGAWFFATHRPPRPRPRRHLAAPVRPRSTTSRAAATRSRSRCSRRPTAGCSGTGFGQALLDAARAADADPAGAAHRPDLRGDRQRARAGRRVRRCCSSTCCSSSAASRSRCSRATRSPSCWPTGLTAVFALQVFVIVGGVTQRDPADRRDAAVRLLRRLVDRRQLRAARAAAARLRPRPREAGAAAMNAPDRPPLRRSSSSCSACSSASRRAGRCSSADALRDNPHNRRALLEEQRIQRGADPRRRRHGARALASGAATARYTRRYPTGRAVRPRGRLLASSRSGRAGLERSLQRRR